MSTQISVSMNNAAGPDPSLVNNVSAKSRGQEANIGADSNLGISRTGQINLSHAVSRNHDGQETHTNKQPMGHEPRTYSPAETRVSAAHKGRVIDTMV